MPANFISLALDKKAVEFRPGQAGRWDIDQQHHEAADPTSRRLKRGDRVEMRKYEHNCKKRTAKKVYINGTVRPATFSPYSINHSHQYLIWPLTTN